MITRNGEIVSLRKPGQNGGRRLNFGDVIAFFKSIGSVFKHWKREKNPVFK
jgi:hypothetical protein